MNPTRFVVCERTGRWATAIRRRLAGSGIRVHETRSLMECWEELLRSPRDLLALEARPDNMVELVERLADLRTRCPRARAMVLLQDGDAARQWLFREAGAIHVVQSVPDLAVASRLVQRHLELSVQLEVGESRSVGDLSSGDLKGLIQDRLPW